MMVRQGDVLLVKVAEMPRGVERHDNGGRCLVREGEATGHAHVIEGAVEEYRSALDERFYAVLEEGGVLTHDEHSAIALEPGLYRLQPQSEWTPEGARWVAD